MRFCNNKNTFDCIFCLEMRKLEKKTLRSNDSREKEIFMMIVCICDIDR